MPFEKPDKDPVIEENLIETVPYDGDRSPEFDDYLDSKDATLAGQEDFSEETRNKLIFTKWHVPCHTIVTRTEEGICQAFHVQPNKSRKSLMTLPQLQEIRKRQGEARVAIAAKGNRSWFSIADENEIADLEMELEQVVSVDTQNWWRLLYDPTTNELWIDNKDKKVLKKYRGFKIDEEEKTRD